MTGSILETAINNPDLDLELKYYEASSSSVNITASADGFRSPLRHNQLQAEFVCLLSILLNQGGQAA